MKQFCVFFCLFCLFCLVSALSKPIAFENGAYKGLTVAVHSKVPESAELLSNLKQLISDSSDFLFNATKGKAHFGDVEIVLPATWVQRDEYEPVTGSRYDGAHIRVGLTNPLIGNEPFTVQPRECGEAGEYIHLTDEFVRNLNGETREEFGHPGRKTFVFFLLSKVSKTKKLLL